MLYSNNGEYLFSPVSDVILAFRTHDDLCTVNNTFLRGKQIMHSEEILVFPPCPIHPDLMSAILTFHQEGDNHHGNKKSVLPVRTWLVVVFKQWISSKGVLKPKSQLTAQLGNVAIMTKVEWAHFQYCKADLARSGCEGPELLYQPLFAERTVLARNSQIDAILDVSFKSRDQEAEEASLRARQEIARLSENGWVAELKELTFY